MHNFVIFIDSTGDLPLDLRTKYDIDYCPMMLNIDGKEVIASLDYDQGYSPKELYDIMRGGTRVFTSQVPNQTFLDKFEPVLAEGKDILYIGCSSRLSASVAAAELLAKNHLRPKFPERKIVCYDSKLACYGQGEMAIYASNLRKEGKTLEEVVAWLDENLFKFNQFATVATLSYLKRAGRVSAGSAFFGNMLGVKPILISDCQGQNFAIEKVKGTKPSLNRIVALALEAAENPEGKTFYIGHADDLAAAEFVESELKRLAPKANTYIGPIGPIIGASTGPGTTAIYVFGKEVTTNRE